MVTHPRPLQSPGGKIDSNGTNSILTGHITGSGPLTISGSNGGTVGFGGLAGVPVLVDIGGTLRGIGVISGAGLFGLSVAGATQDALQDALQDGLGARVTRTFTMDDGQAIGPDLNLRWEHESFDPAFATSGHTKSG